MSANPDAACGVTTLSLKFVSIYPATPVPAFPSAEYNCKKYLCLDTAKKPHKPQRSLLWEMKSPVQLPALQGHKATKQTNTSPC